MTVKILSRRRGGKGLASESKYAHATINGDNIQL